MTDRNEALRLADELAEEAERRVCHVAMAPASLLKDAAALLRQLSAERDQLKTDLHIATDDAAQMLASTQSLRSERDQLRAEVERLRAEVTAARENGFRDGYEQRHAEVLGALT